MLPLFEQSVACSFLDFAEVSLCGGLLFGRILCCSASTVLYWDLDMAFCTVGREGISDMRNYSNACGTVLRNCYQCQLLDGDPVTFIHYTYRPEEIAHDIKWPVLNISIDQKLAAFLIIGITLPRILV